jgi:hypothetical protein
MEQKMVVGKELQDHIRYDREKRGELGTDFGEDWISDLEIWGLLEATVWE